MSLFLFLKSPIYQGRWIELCESMYKTAAAELGSGRRKFPNGRCTCHECSALRPKIQRRLEFFTRTFRYPFLGIHIACAHCGKVFNPVWKITDLWAYDNNRYRYEGHGAVYSWARTVEAPKKGGRAYGHLFVTCSIDCERSLQKEIDREWLELSQFQQVLLEARRHLFLSRRNQRQ